MIRKKTLLVTGGAGFIGSNFIRETLKRKKYKVINFDKLTYAGNRLTIKEFENNKDYLFIKGDIKNERLLYNLLVKYKIFKIVNFAAETHVDRSIINPVKFIETNIKGLFSLLEASRKYYSKLKIKKRNIFLLHISTDEVFGSLKLNAKPFTENSSYKPNNPYSASKASGDHLIRAYNKTYRLPSLICHCGNNYGPRQYPEKLVPLVINNAISNKIIPIYGDGKQKRDWLFVNDSCKAIYMLLEKGKSGENYNIGGSSNITNLDLIHMICNILDVIKPKKRGSYKNQIAFVKDRKGHDRRYSLNSKKIFKLTKFKPDIGLKDGIKETILWYLENIEWTKYTNSKSFKQWIKNNYQIRKRIK